MPDELSDEEARHILGAQGGFRERLRWHLERLDALGVNYRALDGR